MNSVGVPPFAQARAYPLTHTLRVTLILGVHDRVIRIHEFGRPQPPRIRDFGRVSCNDGRVSLDADDLVEEYRPLVLSVAKKVREEYGLRVETDEIVSLGFQGLLEARQRFDATRGVKFNTFAYYRIRGAILDGVRQMAYLPRRIHQALLFAEGADLAIEEYGVARAQQAGTQRTGAQPARTGPTSPEDRQKAQSALEAVLAKVSTSYVLSAMGQGEEKAPESPEARVLEHEAERALHEAVDKLPERERVLVRGHYFDGKHFDDLARELGISKSWASRLHAKALERVRSHLKRNRS